MSMNHSRPPYDLQGLPAVLAGCMGGIAAFLITLMILQAVFG